MSITKFQCDCGNGDPRQTIEYDGALGYEAVICKKCCSYSDQSGAHKADDWSKSMVKNQS